MQCNICGNEMQKGTAYFMPTTGSGQMILSFTSDDEAKKGFFKRQSHGKIIMAGTETEAYYCSKCKSIVIIIKED